MEKISQKDRVMSFIKSRGGSANTNELRHFGDTDKIADPQARARELVRAEKLMSRWISDEEKVMYGYQADVKVFFLPQENGQLTLTG